MRANCERDFDFKIISIKISIILLQAMSEVDKLMRLVSLENWPFSYLIEDMPEGGTKTIDEPDFNQDYERLQREEEDMIEEKQEQAKTIHLQKDLKTVKQEQIKDLSTPISTKSSSVGKAKSTVQVFDRFQNEDNQQSQYICKPQRNTKNKKKISKQAYPTKNFLPVFRPIILNYIEQRCPTASTHPKVIQIKGKKCINCKDYEQLFNIPEFKDALEILFRKRKIYRDLLQSRVQYKLKLKYFERIKVFERAFRTGVFQKIN